MFEGARRPLEVLLVFPAANTAIESYVFNLHLSTLPANGAIVNLYRKYKTLIFMVKYQILSVYKQN